MSEKNTGGLAFPFTPTDRSGQIGPSDPGMTLRDYAAIKFAAAWVVNLMGLEDAEPRHKCAEEANRLGLLQADAFLKAREA